MACIYGYVFARDDKEALQQKKILEKLSIPVKNIFIDEIHASGKEHPMLKKMERKLQKEDLVYIKCLSMLGNSYDEILEQWQILTKKLKTDIAVLDTPLLDTRRGKEIMSSFLSDVVAETLSFVVENEHEKNRRRQLEAYQASKAKGVRYGRPKAPLPENFKVVYQQWSEGNITGVRAAEECGMPLSSFRYRASKYKIEQDQNKDC